MEAGDILLCIVSAIIGIPAAIACVVVWWDVYRMKTDPEYMERRFNEKFSQWKESEIRRGRSHLE